MSRKIILLNLILLALLAAAGWLLRVRWLDARAHERAVLQQTVPPKGLFAPPAPAPVKPAAAADYLEVAQKMLFSKDRNPTVVVDPPKPPPPPPPEPPVPPLPTFYGTFSLFGDSAIILSAGTGKDASQKSYHAGDDVGPFKLVGFDNDSITLEWRGKTINSILQKLVAKNEPPPQPAAQQTPASAQVTSLAPAAPQPAATQIGSSNAGAAPGTPTLGVDMGGGFRACAMGDTTPAGTVFNGYKKVTGMTLMGNSCHWEPAK